MPMRSMTGYGHSAGEGARHRVRVMLRSVNHRFLDLALRLDERLRGSEPALRDLLGTRLSRGRVEVRVEVEGVGPAAARLEVDRELLAQLSRALEGLLEEELIERGLSAGDLVRHPQLLRISEPEAGWEPEDEELLLHVAGEALAELVEARETEGAKLAAVLGERLDALGRTTVELRELAAHDREDALAALRQRVSALVEDQAVDETRLAQEVALLAERSDVREELDRLQAHVEHFRELVGSGDAVGKRLDFLSQEVLRELNTVGAKCRSAAMTRAVLDGKVLCEQLREQVQNVE